MYRRSHLLAGNLLVISTSIAPPSSTATAATCNGARVEQAQTVQATASFRACTLFRGTLMEQAGKSSEKSPSSSLSSEKSPSSSLSSYHSYGTASEGGSSYHTARDVAPPSITAQTRSSTLSGDAAGCAIERAEKLIKVMSPWRESPYPLPEDILTNASIEALRVRLGNEKPMNAMQVADLDVAIAFAEMICSMVDVMRCIHPLSNHVKDLDKEFEEKIIEMTRRIANSRGFGKPNFDALRKREVKIAKIFKDYATRAKAPLPKYSRHYQCASAALEAASECADRVFDAYKRFEKENSFFRRLVKMVEKGDYKQVATNFERLMHHMSVV